MELLFLIAVGFAFKSAFDHVRTTRKASEGARLKEFAKTFRKGEIPKRKLKGAANRHAAGWWLSEAGHGFPVARRGWQAGWIAHRTEAEHHRARLEEAKTTHADVQASVLAGLPEHRERQAEAKARRDAILAHLRDHPTEAKGRKAVQEADAVVLPFPARPRPATPPLPSDTVDRKPAPGPYATVPGVPDDLRPNDPRCLVCHGHGGRTPDLPCSMCGGWSRDAVEAPIDDAVAAADQGFPDEDEHATSDLPEDHELSDHLRPGQKRCEYCDGRGCQVCGGWGAAPPDPEAPLAEPGTICTACGRPGTDDDPVLIDGDTRTHRSHAIQMQQVHAERAARLQDAAAPPTGGSPVSTVEATFHSVIAGARAAVARSDQDSAQIRASKEAAYQLADQMAAAGVDPAAIEAQMNHADALAKAEAALAEAGEHAQSTAATTEKFHGGMQEAHDSAPGKVAEREFHGGS